MKALLLLTLIAAGDGEAIDELRALAELLEKSGDDTGALDVYEQLRRRDPENPDWVDAVLSTCERLPECRPRRLELVGEARRFFPDRAELAHEHYRLLTAQNGVTIAVEMIGRYLERHPADRDARLMQIEGLRQLNRRQGLDRAIAALARDHPNHASTWIVHAFRALELNRTHVATSALAHAKRATNRDPDSDTDIAAIERELEKIRDEQQAELRRRLDADGFDEDLEARDDL